MHSLDCNSISDAGAQRLSEALDDNRTILSLNGLPHSGRGNDLLRLNGILLKIPAWVDSTLPKVSALREVLKETNALFAARISMLAFGDELLDREYRRTYKSWRSVQSRDFAMAHLLSSAEAALERALSAAQA